MAAPRVLVPLAPGFEELEAVTIIDVLRRAGLDVVTAGLKSGAAIGSHRIAIMPDAMLEKLDAQTFDVIVLPGGMPGAEHLRDEQSVQDAIRAVRNRGGYTAAICAGPIALSKAGATIGKRATSYPGFGTQINCKDYVEERVVVDGKLVTSRGPGTAMEFALELVRLLVGEAKVAQLRGAMLVESA